MALEVRFIVTRGNGHRPNADVTPEATEAICERVIDGVAERMRSEGYKKTPFAALSRGVCGGARQKLDLNLPAVPAGRVESLQAVMELVPHALNLPGWEDGYA